MSVILRCPNCGTSRGTPGECDACHDAEVRYYCSNHAPGLWLESPACTRCGARFGEAAPAAAPPPTGPTFGRVPRTPPPPSRDAVFGRVPAPPPPPPPSRDAVFGRHEESARTAPAGSLDDVLAEMARARRGMPPAGPPGMDPRVAVRGVGGCLVRAVVMLVVFIFMIFAGVFMFAGSMFRIW